MSPPDLRRLFAPESVAVVGASADPDSLTGRPHRFLADHGYPGAVYLVNPNRERIDGERCYDAVTDLPEAPDLALVLVPARVAPEVVRDCGERGVAFALVIASGFGESGHDGREADLRAAAAEAGVRLVGPNSEGFLNLPDRVAATFSSLCKRDDLRPGPVGITSQSGAFGGAILQLFQNRGVGTSTWVSTGNEVDLDTLDYLAHLVDDDETDVVVSYVESLDDARRLLEVGRRAALTGTDLVAMRVGASDRGEVAAASHTGSVASSDAVYDAVFDQAGVRRVRSVDELLDVTEAFVRLPAEARPDPTGGLAVVSMSGGAAVLVADAAEAEGLPLASLGEATTDVVADIIPEYGSARNPLDVTAAAIADHEVFRRCITAVADDPDANALLVQFSNSGREVVESVEDDLVDLRESRDLPVVCVFTGSVPREETRRRLVERGVLVFEDPVRAVRTCAHLQRRARAVDRLRSSEPVAEPHGDRTLPGDVDALAERLAAYDAPLVDTRVVESQTAAVEAAERVGYPVVVKADPLRVAHKTEAGGVHRCEDADAVRRAVEAVETPAVVQPVRSGVEALVGVREDDDFGPVLTLGVGGVLVELFEEDRFAHRAVPVSEEAAREMIRETPLERLLGGYRGQSGDADALARFVAGLSACYCDHSVRELECNPVVVTDDDAVAVDVLVE